MSSLPRRGSSVPCGNRRTSTSPSPLVLRSVDARGRRAWPPEPPPHMVPSPRGACSHALDGSGAARRVLLLYFVKGSDYVPGLHGPPWGAPSFSDIIRWTSKKQTKACASRQNAGHEPSARVAAAASLTRQKVRMARECVVAHPRSESGRGGCQWRLKDRDTLSWQARYLLTDQPRFAANALVGRQTPAQHELTGAGRKFDAVATTDSSLIDGGLYGSPTSLLVCLGYHKGQTKRAREGGRGTQTTLYSRNGSCGVQPILKRRGGAHALEIAICDMRMLSVSFYPHGCF
ncbi:hypothetical protein C8Q78DRAFT_512695 [Trametes maxima]|nr:hypothetical protein C8Q78DRAFT_512695 [Trametes maxima]